MFTRRLKRPAASILLLGPRGTGKSTWIQQNFPGSTRYDLLDTREALRLSKEPNLLFSELEKTHPGTWVAIDEIQKVPALLNEVHRLIEQRRLKFILCGSSAWKLKQKGTNLLAGRARLTELFPLVSAEINFQLTLPKIVRYGLLPTAFTDKEPESYLRSYADVYLQEEIKGEAVTRNIGNFGRFLEIAARQNAQITNVSGIARDAQVARQTVQGYFDILADTLIGVWLHPWKLKRATKQIAHPKFYFFDCGIARALSGRLPYPPTLEELGHLFETFILHELRAYLAYAKLRYPINFWSSHDKVEVDFFFETAKGYIAVECKTASRWDKKSQRGLERIREEIGDSKVRCFGVYFGERRATFGKVNVFPVIDFLKRLWNGEIV